MKKIILSLITLSSSLFPGQEKVKFVSVKSDANLTIFITFNRLEADKVIYLTQDTQYKQRGVWQLVENSLDADFTVFETVNRREADMIIFFTENINDVTK